MSATATKKTVTKKPTSNGKATVPDEHGWLAQYVSSQPPKTRAMLKRIIAQNKKEAEKEAGVDWLAGVATDAIMEVGNRNLLPHVNLVTAITEIAASAMGEEANQPESITVALKVPPAEPEDDEPAPVRRLLPKLSNPERMAPLLVEGLDCVEDASRAVEAIHSMVNRVAEAETELSNSELFAILDIASDASDQLDCGLNWLKQAQRRAWEEDDKRQKTPEPVTVDGDEAVAAMRMLADLPEAARDYIITGERSMNDGLLDADVLRLTLGSCMIDMMNAKCPLIAAAQAVCLMARACADHKVK